MDILSNPCGTHLGGNNWNGMAPPEEKGPDPRKLHGGQSDEGSGPGCQIGVAKAKFPIEK